MSIVTVIASLLAAAVLAGSAATKFLGTRFSTETAAHLGLSPALNRVVGICETAAVVGLVGGLLWWPLGIAAAGGVMLLMLGALTFHRRAGDSMATAAPALLVLVLAITVLAGHSWMVAT